VIDYHQHLFSPDLAKLVRLDTLDADKLIALLDSAGIRRAVVLSVAYSWSNPSRNVENVRSREAENDWVAAQVARHPDRLRGFCSVNPLRDYALTEIDRCATNPLLRTGLKLHIGNSAVDYHSPQDLAKLRDVFRAANKKRMAVVIHLRASISRRLPFGREEARIFLDSILPEARDIPVRSRISPAPEATTAPRTCVVRVRGRDRASRITRQTAVVRRDHGEPQCHG
jgi:predicted TIM-barrel fold metal-dependent hydrolase